LLTASVADGYSAFGSRKSKGTFPSLVSVGVFEREVHEFKVTELTVNSVLHGGVNGTCTLVATLLFRPDNGQYQYISPSGAVILVSPLYVSRLQNQLEVERTESYNLGLDYSLFNDRITGTFDAYENQQRLLELRTIPDVRFRMYWITLERFK
jgi:hypothetical protein